MPAQKPVRRTQIISPFGIGSMVDFPKDESLMPSGLDSWPCAKTACPPDSGWLIREERLEARLGISHFRMPPDHRDPEYGVKYANQDVPFVRFPRWHYCHHCGGMEYLSIFQSGRERCAGRPYSQQSCAERPKFRRPQLIPVRFVAVCDMGHIQDFPFVEWLHKDGKKESINHQLRLRAGRSSAGLSGITIECSCGESRNLGDIFRFDDREGGVLAKIGCDCKGLRPWLGEMEAGAEPCGHHLRILQRGALNVYFPQLMSSIYLPLWAETADRDIIALLDQPHIWSILSQATTGGKIDTLRCETVAGMAGVNANDLLEAAQRKLDGKTATASGEDLSTEEKFRSTEYQAIVAGKVGPQSELFVEKMEVDKYSSWLKNYFTSICLVHKLRETRALVGFTRILPPDGNISSPRLQKLKLDPRIDWLPAIKVYGEGIFLEFNISAIQKWTKKTVEQRPAILSLIDEYNAARQKRLQRKRAITPKFILLHTIAHILINQLSFDCGYGSASLRERIYCDIDDPSRPMQGILIYTASGDSEGTMGGLVRQGREGRLEPTIERALARARWCSSDPVCIESSGQGADNANLAACHGCSLLPETSCEEGNRLLDRALLIGTPDNLPIGFFYHVKED